MCVAEAIKCMPVSGELYGCRIIYRFCHCPQAFLFQQLQRMDGFICLQREFPAEIKQVERVVLVGFCAYGNLEVFCY